MDLHVRFTFITTFITFIIYGLFMLCLVLLGNKTVTDKPIRRHDTLTLLIRPD